MPNELIYVILLALVGLLAIMTGVFLRRHIATKKVDRIVNLRVAELRLTEPVTAEVFDRSIEIMRGEHDGGYSQLDSEYAYQTIEPQIDAYADRLAALVPIETIPSLRIEWLELLGRCKTQPGTAVAVRRLRDELKNSDETLRATAIAALDRIGTADAIAILREHQKTHPDDDFSLAGSEFRR